MIPVGIVEPDTRPELEAELRIWCPDCCAKVGERCAYLTDASKYMPMSHYRRRALARAVSVKESTDAT